MRDGPAPEARCGPESEFVRFSGFRVPIAAGDTLSAVLTGVSQSQWLGAFGNQYPEGSIGLRSFPDAEWISGSTPGFPPNLVALQRLVIVAHRGEPPSTIAPTALAAASLGRPLSGGTGNVRVNLLQSNAVAETPGTATAGVLQGDRVNQIDLRIG